MSRPGSFLWFAERELRLFLRDYVWLLARGRRRGGLLLGIAVIVLASLEHFVAYFLIKKFPLSATHPTQITLLLVAGAMILCWALVLSQATESVARIIYTRTDYDLILSSPAPTHRFFVVRLTAVTVSSMLLASFIFGPFINMLAIMNSPLWLSAYFVVLAICALSTAMAVLIVRSLFGAIGPRRARLVVQMVSAGIGAIFVIGIQIGAIISTGTLSRFALLQADWVRSLSPSRDGTVWWLVSATFGATWPLVIFIATSLVAFAVVTVSFASRFPTYLTAVAGARLEASTARRGRRSFHDGSVTAALRRKEVLLLRRDPWLLSQTLMQILYLLPVVVFLWMKYGSGDHVLVLVPVIVMAAGQLAGGLSWIVVSSDDAPDLVAGAPIRAGAILSAKVWVVLETVIIFVTPLLVGLAMVMPIFAGIAAVGVVMSSLSATWIHFWFREDSRRSVLRKRQIPSRIVTTSEATSSILWASTAALTATSSWFASITASVALFILAGLRVMRPSREGRVQ